MKSKSYRYRYECAMSMPCSFTGTMTMPCKDTAAAVSFSVVLGIVEALRIFVVRLCLRIIQGTEQYSEGVYCAAGCPGF